MQCKIVAILFDLDGTLYTSQVSISEIARRVLNQLGLVHVNEMTEREIMRLILDGPENWLSTYMLTNNVASNWQPSSELWIEYCKRFLLSFGVNDASKENVNAFKSEWEEYGPPGRGLFRPQLVDRVENILEELHARGYKLGISTNRIYSPEIVLEEDSIIKYFSCVEHTGVPGYEKPSPYMLLRFATEVAVNPLRCAFVGDRIDIDVVAARSAGMIPVLANWNAMPQRHLPDGLLVANRIEDLLGIFSEI